jgi:hypothetical protein
MNLKFFEKKLSHGKDALVEESRKTKNQKFGGIRP